MWKNAFIWENGLNLQISNFNQNAIYHVKFQQTHIIFLTVFEVAMRWPPFRGTIYGLKVAMRWPLATLSCSTMRAWSHTTIVNTTLSWITCA
jgi:hypothetical protein